MTFNGFGADEIEYLQKNADKDDLTVMADSTDPFFAGRERGHRVKAQWFKEVFERYAVHLAEIGQHGRRPHLRAVHYWLQSLGDVTKPDGELYVNTYKCDKYLRESARYARYLGTVDPLSFIDNKNPEARVYVTNDPSYYEGAHVVDSEPWSLPHIDAALIDSSMMLPNISLSISSMLDLGGFKVKRAALAAQPYHIEIWCEKSTMDEVLLPICERYGANYVSFGGTPSITSGALLIERLINVGKPVRIFYVSDADPEGKNMPVQVARYIQFWTMREALDNDIKLNPIVLTAEQIERYKLPKAPDGKSVELDALEALYPNELKKIVTKHIEQYYDEELESEYADYVNGAYEAIDGAEASEITPYNERIQEFKDRINVIIEPYRREVEQIRDAIAQNIAPFQDELEMLYNEVCEAAENAANNVELPEPPEPEPEADESDNVLYDSTRDYFTQTEILKALKPKKPKEKRRRKGS